VPCSLALLNDACRGDAGPRARAVGLWTAAGGVGIAAGPILGGLLIGLLGWRSIFFVNLPVGVAGIWLTLRFLDQPPPAQKKRGLDLTGQTLAAVALLGVVWAIIEAGPSGWHSPLVLSGIVLAVTSGFGFIVVERKSPDPAVPVDLFRHMNVSTTMLLGFAVNGVMYGVTFAFALYFQRVLSFSTVETGIAFLPFGLNGNRGKCRRGPQCRPVRPAGADVYRACDRGDWLRCPIGDRSRHDLFGDPAGSATHQARHRTGRPRDYDRHVSRSPISQIGRCFRCPHRHSTDRGRGRRRDVRSLDDK